MITRFPLLSLNSLHFFSRCVLFCFFFHSYRKLKLPEILSIRVWSSWECKVPDDPAHLFRDDYLDCLNCLFVFGLSGLWFVVFCTIRKNTVLNGCCVVGMGFGLWKSLQKPIESLPLNSCENWTKYFSNRLNIKAKGHQRVIILVVGLHNRIQIKPKHGFKKCSVIHL